MADDPDAGSRRRDRGAVRHVRRRRRGGVDAGDPRLGDPLEAVGSTIPSVIPSAVSGSLRYRREGLIIGRVALWTLAAGLAATVGGALLTGAVPGNGHLLDRHSGPSCVHGLSHGTGAERARAHTRGSRSTSRTRSAISPRPPATSCSRTNGIPTGRRRSTAARPRSGDSGVIGSRRQRLLGIGAAASSWCRASRPGSG